MAPGASHVFPDVVVSIPTGVPADPDGEVAFAALSTGKVEVDAGRDMTLEFTAAASIPTKPLGRLLRASAIPADEEGRQLDVKAEGLAALYRFKFASSRDAQRFSDLALQAESEEFTVWRQAEQDRAKRAEELEAAIGKRFADDRPLVYSGAQLFGPDDGGDEGSEVLLGEGAVVLLDPPGDCKTPNKYELLFFGVEEGVEAPVKSVSIAPKMVLRRLERERAEIDDDEAPAASFSLAGKGVATQLVLAFDSVTTAGLFERDFTVRQRVMDFASMTAKSQHAVDDARAQLDELRQPGFVAGLSRLWRLFQLLVAVPVLTLLLFAALPQTRGMSLALGSKICRTIEAASAGGALLTVDVRRCFDLGGVTLVLDCVEKLLESS